MEHQNEGFPTLHNLEIIHRLRSTVKIKKRLAAEFDRIRPDTSYVPKKFPSDHEIPEISLLPSKYCNVLVYRDGKALYFEGIADQEKTEAGEVFKLANYLVREFGAKTVNEKIDVFFNYVQEHIYLLGINNHTAYESFKVGHGSCSNKANMFAALCRSQGIPVLPYIIHLKGALYLGRQALIPQLGCAISIPTIHIFAIVHNGTKWLPVDPSDNLQLSLPCIFISQPSAPLSYNPIKGSWMNFPNSIVLGEHIGNSFDDLLSRKIRKSKNGPAFQLKRLAPEYFNLYMEYITTHDGRLVNGKELRLPQKLEDFYDDFCMWLNQKDNGSETSFEKRRHIFESYSKYLNEALKEDENTKKLYAWIIKMRQEFKNDATMEGFGRLTRERISPYVNTDVQYPKYNLPRAKL